VRPNLIILFAKAPVPGKVKTRLAPILTPEAAAELHSTFVDDMIHRFRSLEGSDFELHTDIRNDAWIDTGVTRKLQISGDLGLRMVHALEAGLQAGYSRVLILGSDAPTLPVAHVQTLLSADSDIALGPAEDGGFYAIAARRTDTAMLHGVSWSQSTTLAETVEAITRCGLSVELGPVWFDVDTPEDLQRLIASRSGTS
jgi:uncharacterized protein